MCLIAFAVNQHPHYPLIILANRDEFLARPTQPLSQWSDNPQIIGGRDLSAGGTWLAVSPAGQWAALTNFRNPSESPKPRSRGEIIVRYLSLDHALPNAMDSFIKALKAEHQEFNGFNLVLGDLNLQRQVFVSNHPWSATNLKPGTYAVSNGPINDQWPKMTNFHQGMLTLLEQMPADFDMALQLMTQSIDVSDAALPDTGISLDLERVLAQPFIKPFELNDGLYGTRSSALVLAEQSTQNNGLNTTAATSKLSWQFV